MKQILIPKKNHLETEKSDFLKVLLPFIENMQVKNFEGEQFYGRPKAPLDDILKCLIIMNYHSLSYRRSVSDFKTLKKEGVLRTIPKRSTLSKYMNDPVMPKILEELIEVSALSFVDIEDCLMLDSSQFFDRVLFGGTKAKSYHKSRLFQVPTLSKTRKLHISIGKTSKIIICARTSIGTVHDHKLSRELIETSLRNGFHIKTLLADAAYNSRENFALCEDHGIKAYLDFKKNHKIKNSKTKLRKQQFILYHEHKELWHEEYRFRVIIEMIFGAIKKKGRPYLRSKNVNSKDCEMLLKALWYNLCIIAKHMDTL